MKVFSEIQKRGHEQVTMFHYPEVGLKSVVAIHSSVLGPALGGCRMRIYQDENAAIDDALRLAEGMTYKNSLAGLDLGGGKSVLIADPKMTKGRRELFLQFGECLNNLGGRYITAEDMGTSVADVMTMREVSKFAAGFAPEQGGGGDPSPWTAKGVFFGMQSACAARFGSADLKGKHVTVQGAGHVGMYLIKHLRDAGAKVTVCDTVESCLTEAKGYGCEIVSTDAIYDVKADIYAPCAVGQTVNPETLKRLNCTIIAGAANNQLSDASVYGTIESKKITYCPDFAINAGGVISVGAEYVNGGWKESWVAEKVNKIGGTIARIIDESDKRKKFPEVVALELAKERIHTAQEQKRAK